MSVSRQTFHQARISGRLFKGVISGDGPYLSTGDQGVALVVSALRQFQPDGDSSRRARPYGW